MACYIDGGVNFQGKFSQRKRKKKNLGSLSIPKRRGRKVQLGACHIKFKGDDQGHALIGSKRHNPFTALNKFQINVKRKFKLADNKFVRETIRRVEQFSIA